MDVDFGEKRSVVLIEKDAVQPLDATRTFICSLVLVIFGRIRGNSVAKVAQGNRHPLAADRPHASKVIAIWVYAWEAIEEPPHNLDYALPRRFIKNRPTVVSGFSKFPRPRTSPLTRQKPCFSSPPPSPSFLLAWTYFSHFVHAFSLVNLPSIPVQMSHPWILQRFNDYNLA